jgi:hypothetical protein
MDVMHEQAIEEDLQRRETKMRAAKEIFGEDYFGPEAVEKAFGVHLELKDIPDIPFTVAEMERSRVLGEYMMLRIDKGADGRPLTLNSFVRLGQTHSPTYVSQRIWNFSQDPFFCEETPRRSWALVTPNCLPSSFNKNYFSQTLIALSYLRNDFFRGKVPKRYQSAIEDFESHDREIASAISQSRWASYNPTKAFQKLKTLLLTDALRPSPVEVAYDQKIFSICNQTRIFQDEAVWTSCAADDSFVYIRQWEQGDYTIGKLSPATVAYRFGTVVSRRM